MPYPTTGYVNSAIVHAETKVAISPDNQPECGWLRLAADCIVVPCLPTTFAFDAIPLVLVVVIIYSEYADRG